MASPAAARPRFEPMPLGRLHAPFDHPNWIFELKYDGWRALAYIDHGKCSLVSRNGNAFKRFADLCAGMAAVKNPKYSQSEGRAELFDGLR